MRPPIPRSRRSRDFSHGRGSSSNSSASLHNSGSSSPLLPPPQAQADERDGGLVAVPYNHSSSGSDTLSLSLSRNPSPKPIAPYNPSTPSAEQNLQALIYHYNTVMVGSGMCPGPKRQFYPFAMQHEPLFHTIMYCAAAHLARLQDRDPPPEALYHHSQALRLFNQKLAEGPSSADLQGLISTTCLMTALETFEGTPENSLIHWDGLSRLVEAAGGLDAVNVLGNTRRNVLWADLCASAALGLPPRFDPHRPSLTSAPTPLIRYFGPPSRLTDIYAQAFGSKLYSVTGHVALSQLAATVYWGLRNLSKLDAVRQMESFTDTADIHAIQVSDRVEMLERINVNLWHDASPAPAHPHGSRTSNPHGSGSGLGRSARDAAHPAVFKILGSALLIHIYANLRDMPITVRIMSVHAARILAAMDAAGAIAVDALGQAFPDMMLWVLLLGGRAARDPKHKAVFAQKMACILAAMGVEGKRAVEEAAGRFLAPVARGNRRGPAAVAELDWEHVDRLLS